MSAHASDGDRELAPRLHALRDRRAVIDTICRLDYVLDDKRFDDLPTVYAADVRVDFPSGSMAGLDVLADFGARRMAAYDAMQHATTTFVVTVDGDRARARMNQISTHVHRGQGAGSHHESGVVHRFELVRTADGWRIAVADAEVIWNRGTPSPRVPIRPGDA